MNPETSAPRNPSTEQVAEAPVAEGRGRALKFKVDLAWGAGTGVAAIVAFALVTHLWEASLHVPINGAAGDASFNLAVIKGMVEHGWYWSNSNLGAPAGQQLFDFSVYFGDLTHFLIMKLMTIGSSDPVAIMNVYYVLCYGLSAIAAFVVFRWLGIARGIAASMGVLFALLPYHLLRQTSHLFLTSYFSVPFGCWLILIAGGAVRGFDRLPTESGVKSWRTRRTAVILAVAAFVGITDDYYAVFTILLLIPVGILAALALRNLRALIAPAVITGTIVAAVLACQIPPFFYHSAHGSDPAVATRSPAESEIYGLKITSLVFPRPDHRLPPFAHLAAVYGSTTPIDSEGPSPSLGTFGTVGLIVILIGVLTAAAGRPVSTVRQRLVRTSGMAAIWAIGLGTIGGGGAVIAYLFTSQVRGWDRISVFIEFFSLVGLAALLARGLEYGSSRISVRMLAPVVLGSVTALGVLDQTTVDDVPAYATIHAAWTNDARFVEAIEHRITGSPMILQLPYVPFPENPPVVNMADYTELDGYLHSSRLRWSYAQIKGRIDDWGAEAENYPTNTLIAAATAAGFSGVYVNRYGFSDGGAAVIAALRKLVGAGNEIDSDDGALLFFDLRAYSKRLAQLISPQLLQSAGASLVHPVKASFGPGFYQAPEQNSEGVFHWARAEASLALANPTATPRTLDISFTLATYSGSNRALISVRIPGVGTLSPQPDQSHPATISRRLTIPPGGETLRFSTSAPDAAPPGDPRDLHFQLLNLQLTQVPVEQLAAAIEHGH